MTPRRWLGCLVLAALVLLVGQPPAQAQKVQKLPWKAFDPGSRPFYQILQTKTAQKMKVQDQDIKQNQDQTFYLKWIPGPRKERIAGKDHWVVTLQIIGMKCDIDMGGNKIVYDSTLPNQAGGPLTDFFGAWSAPKSPTTSVRFEDRPDRQGGGTAGEAGQGQPANGGLAEDHPQRRRPQANGGTHLGRLPAGGKNSRRRSRGKAPTNWISGPIGSYANKHTYTCGPDPLKIKIRTVMNYQAPAKAEGLPFKITKANLSGLTAREGEAVFDSTRGRRKTTMVMQVEGDLTIEVGGQETMVRLSQVQETNLATPGRGSGGRDQEEPEVAPVSPTRERGPPWLSRANGPPLHRPGRHFAIRAFFSRQAVRPPFIITLIQPRPADPAAADRNPLARVPPQPHRGSRNHVRRTPPVPAGLPAGALPRTATAQECQGRPPRRRPRRRSSSATPTTATVCSSPATSPTRPSATPPAPSSTPPPTPPSPASARKASSGPRASARPSSRSPASASGQRRRSRSRGCRSGRSASPTTSCRSWPGPAATAAPATGPPRARRASRFRCAATIPPTDHVTLTRGTLGRRLDLLEPGQSLLLLKPTGRVPHEGGKRFDARQRLRRARSRRWIAEGAGSDLAAAPQLVGIEVSPAVPHASRSRAGAAAARAGHATATAAVRDVDRRRPLLQQQRGRRRRRRDRPGPACRTRARRPSWSATARSSPSAPRRPRSTTRPSPGPTRPENNYIDQHVHAKLKQMEILPSDLTQRRGVPAPRLLRPDSACRRRRTRSAPSSPTRPVGQAGTAIDELLERPEHAEFWAVQVGRPAQAALRPAARQGHLGRCTAGCATASPPTSRSTASCAS